jgi:hypothetical protein
VILAVHHEVATEAATAELLLLPAVVADVKSTSPTFVHLQPFRKKKKGILLEFTC